MSYVLESLMEGDKCVQFKDKDQIPRCADGLKCEPSRPGFVGICVKGITIYKVYNELSMDMDTNIKCFE